MKRRESLHDIDEDNKQEYKLEEELIERKWLNWIFHGKWQKALKEAPADHLGVPD